MKKDDDFINESSINDLIRYAEDEDNTPEEEENVAQGEDIITNAADDEQIPEEKEAENYTEEQAEAPIEQYGKIKYEEYTEEDISKELYNDDYEDYDNDGNVVFEKSKNKKGIIASVIIGILAVTIFIIINSGGTGNYKNNFSNNFSKIFAGLKTEKQIQDTESVQQPEVEYNTEVTDSVIVSLGDISGTEFEPYNNGILCASMNHLLFADNTGNTVWETDTAIVDPILDVSGNYILLAENGGRKICLYNDSFLVYDVDDPDNIMTAKTSKSGDVVAVTNKSSYRGGISVYNKSGEQIFSWASGSDTVISADISAATRHVAVSLLNTDETAKTIIQLFDVNKTDSYSKTDINDTVIFDLQFTNCILNAFGDNRIVGLSDGGKLIYDNTFENVQLIHSVSDDKGNKLLLFDNSNVPMLNIYSKRGKLKSNVTLTGMADFIDICGKDMIYNIGRDVYFGRTDSKNMTKYTAAMDIKGLFIISDNIFVIAYSNSFEIVTV